MIYYACNSIETISISIATIHAISLNRVHPLFCFFFLCYWLIARRSVSWQNILLLVGSYFFYGWLNYRFLGILIGLSTIDYFVGLRIAANRNVLKRRRWLGVSLCANVGTLIYFKYAGFFLVNFQSVASVFGLTIGDFTQKFAIPLGLSFIVFRSLSYTIDVYRGSIEPVKNPLLYFLYVGYFPQVVSGPIERARHLIPQFESARKLDEAQIRSGLRQVLWGFFKKLVIADNLAPIVDSIFKGYQSADSFTLALGAIFYSFQIYADFSGYTDIAIGVGSLLGFRSVRNFHTPFFSRDIAEFWRRWHISLSTWLFEYIYAPLGGIDPSRIRRITAILITFLVSGLWHGANWTFIGWGLLNGLYYFPIVASHHRKPFTKDVKSVWFGLPSLRDAGRMVATFSLVTIGLILFRSNSIADGMQYIVQIVTTTPVVTPTYWGYILVCLGLISWEWIHRHHSFPFEIKHYPMPVRWGLYVALILAIAVFGNFSAKQFVYFQF